MTTNQLIPFNAAGALPAHIASAFTDEEANTQGRPTIDQLSYRGKVWRLVLKGEEHALTKTDENGEINPVQSVALVVLDLNKARSRSYYEGAYEDGKNQAPICYSADGVTPDASVQSPQAPTCASCQWSVKGSKITESNKQTTACSPFKRIAVVPSQRIADHPALLLRLAQTSVWDKDTEDGADGWYAWDQYVDMLRRRGAKHTAAVETRVKFDISVPYPKLLFSASRWLSPEETVAVKARLADVATQDIIKGILTGGARDGVMGQPAAPAQQQRAQGTIQTAKQPAPNPVAALDLSGLIGPGETSAPAAAATVAKVETAAAAAVAGATTAKVAPKVPPKVPAKAPAWPPEGWTQHPDDPTYWFNATDEVITEEELRARVVPAAAPAAPKVPKAPKTPKVEKVKAEPVDDGFGGATQPPAAAATPVQATPVVTGAPVGLASLLEGWDDA